MFRTQCASERVNGRRKKKHAQRFPMWRREVKIIHTKEGKHTGSMRSCLVHQELHITPQLGARVNEIPLAVMKEFYPSEPRRGITELQKYIRS